MDAIKNYIDSGNALREKYDEIRRGIVIRRKVLEEDFNPLVKPLREISEKLDSKQPGEDVLKRMGPLAEKYIRHRVKPDLKFGIYSDGDNFYIGQIPLIILENDLHFENGMKFAGTPGLWELITLEHPKTYTNEDLANYEKIVLTTHTYRHNNDPNAKNVKSSTGYKYTHFIKPILQKNNIIKQPSGKKMLSYLPSLAEEMDDASEKSGSGLRKILTNAPVEYVYWNNFDELLDRLYIVYGEIKSGNNNPNLINELVDILQEIKEI